MGNEYLKYPTTVKLLAGEIIKVCNDYNARKINNDEIKEIILWYATKMPDKLFMANDLNPTIKKIIGSKRIFLINTLLDGYQTSI